MKPAIRFFTMLFFIVNIAISVDISIATAGVGDGGDQVGNGGGLAEQNISFAFLNLQKIYKLCLTSNLCLSQKADRQLLSKIADELPNELKNSQPLIFLSGAQHPEKFLIDKQMKLAVTGSHVGDAIYFNTDLIYQKDPYGQVAPMSIPAAMGILTHELGHHHQIVDHTYLDLLGAHVHTFALQAMNTLVVDTYLDIGDVRSPRLVLTAIHSRMQSGSDLQGAESLLLFADESEVHDLSVPLNAALAYCPANQQYKKSRAIGYRLFDIHWDGGSIQDGTTQRRVYVVRARVELFCQNFADVNYPVRFDVDHELKLSLPVYFRWHGDQDSNSGANQFRWELQAVQIQAEIKPMR